MHKVAFCRLCLLHHARTTSHTEAQLHKGCGLAPNYVPVVFGRHNVWRDQSKPAFQVSHIQTKRAILSRCVLNFCLRCLIHRY